MSRFRLEFQDFDTHSRNPNRIFKKQTLRVIIFLENFKVEVMEVNRFSENITRFVPILNFFIPHAYELVDKNARYTNMAREKSSFNCSNHKNIH